jgi:flagellar hook-associated protein 2
VTASIIDDGTPGAGFRLVLTSDQTGTAAAATIDDSGFVPAGQALGFTSIATGQDAVFSVNGLTVTRATNVVSDVLSGVTLTLKDPGATTVSVARNLDDVKKKIGEFVSAYNDVVSEVRVHRNYADREGKASLYGDSNLDRILSRLQSKLGETVAGLSADANAFADLGFTFGADGKIATDAEALSNAVESNYDGVVALFTQLGTGGGAGLARSVSTAVGEVITQMVLPKTASLSGRASSLNKRVGALETQLEKYAEQLRKRYAALETFAGRFQSAGATLNALGS